MNGTATIGTAITYARADHTHPSDTSRAPLASPTLTGTPAAPTAVPGTTTTQIATTQFVASAITNVASSTTPVMNGSAAIGTAATFARADHVHPSDTSRAPLSSPIFSGTPAAPTAIAGTSTTQIATTQFVVTAITSAASLTTPMMNGTAAVGLATTYARADHVHPSDTSRAPLNSPTFTGAPAAPTAAPGTNTAQIATTQFVTTAIMASVTGVSSFNTRTGAITLESAEITSVGGALLVSPIFTGMPAGPTAAVDNSTAQLATTAFVLNQAASIAPLVNGTATIGTSPRYARADHVHPTDTTLLPKSGGTLTGALHMGSNLLDGSNIVITGGSLSNITSLAISGAGNALTVSSSASIGGKLTLSGLPTSVTGLTSGQVWNNGGVLCIA